MIISYLIKFGPFMYFSNGLINIKNILVISLLFSLSLSVVFLNNYIIKWNPEIAADEKYKGKLKTTEVYFHCNRDFHYFLESNIEKRSQIHKQLKKICEKIYFDHDNSSIYYCWELDPQLMESNCYL